MIDKKILMQIDDDGDATSLEQLMPLAYDELRRLAVRYLRRESANHDLEPTDLINEAYLRLADRQRVEWQSRAEFYGLASKAMRNILVHHVPSPQEAARGRGKIWYIDLRIHKHTQPANGLLFG